MAERKKVGNCGGCIRSRKPRKKFLIQPPKAPSKTAIKKLGIEERKKQKAMVDTQPENCMWYTSNRGRGPNSNGKLSGATCCPLHCEKKFLTQCLDAGFTIMEFVRVVAALRILYVRNLSPAKKMKFFGARVDNIAYDQDEKSFLRRSVKFVSFELEDFVKVRDSMARQRMAAPNRNQNDWYVGSRVP